MNIHKFKLEQFDDANALANISNCNLLGMRAHACWTLPVELWSHFSQRELNHYAYSSIQTRTVWRRQRARKHLELQFLTDVRAPFAGPYLLNFEVIVLKEIWVSMNIHKFKLEQFDDANALANISSCNLLRMCAHPLLDPTCWTSNSCFAKRNESLWTFINSN